jgi:hypothetical protein
MIDQACDIREGGNKLKQVEGQPSGIMKQRLSVRNRGR